MSENPKLKIRVMLADDHEIVRQGIEKALAKASDIAIVGHAANGLETIQLAQEVDADILLMDIQMPQKNGWDVMMELKSLKPKLRVIIFSMFPEEQYGVRFMRAGAAGFLNKSSTPVQILDAIRRVYQGKKYVSPELADLMLEDIGKPAFEESLHARLSDREFQVFCMIAQGKKLKDIAEELSVGITTISTHRQRILEKMGMKTNAELIQYAVKNNLA